MASDDHKICSSIIKNTHTSLRLLARKIGHKEAWKKHCEDTAALECYANNMKLLATNHWEKGFDKETCSSSRITWISNYCEDYFFNKINKYRQREQDIAGKLNIDIKSEMLSKKEILDVLDVGSCYNPFKDFRFMNVLPIDLHPADKSVLQCDFLNVKLGQILKLSGADISIEQLPEGQYDAVIFSLLLEYFPSSLQRKECCEKAYKLLKHEGILVIISPDSKHVGANAKIMKNWRYTLSLMGFSRISYEKLSYLHCMVFRKSIAPEIAQRWALLYKETYMVDEMNIPQDFNNYVNVASEAIGTELNIKEDANFIMESFDQLPFSIEN